MIKVLCDICNTEEEIEACAVAHLEFCRKHHMEYHDLLKETIDRLNAEMKHKTKQAVEMLKKRHRSADVVKIKG